MTEPADSVIRQAEAHYFQGRCDDAIRMLADFITLAPDSEAAVIRAAELLIDSDRHARALEFLDKISADRMDPRGAYLHGVCHHALGDVDAAARIADRILTEKGRDAPALVLKARTAAFHGKADEVERLLAEAVECDPGCGIAWHDYAGLRRQQGDAEAYFHLAAKAFACAPESRAVVTAFHESALASQRLAEAETAFREALSGRRMDRRLRYLLIDLLLRQHHDAEAMAAVESAIVDFGVDPGIVGAALKIREKLGPLSLPLTAKPGGDVSLCIIAKNERSHLARCLASAKPVVDEIIVVDTGSSDETKDLAVVFGAKVFDFAWVDDFSKARNYSLSKASGDWILVLDADEALSSKDYEGFRRLLEGCRPAAFRMQTRNYSNLVNTVGFRPNRGEYPDEAGMGWYPSDKVRLFQNDSRIHFDYPVHELVEPSLSDLKIPIHECAIAIHHYGVLNNAQALHKTSAYRKLGRKKMKNFKDSNALKEAAIQSARAGRNAESLDLWRRFLQRHPRSAEAYLNIGAVCANMGRQAEAVTNAHNALELDPKLKEARFNLAFALLMLGEAEEARKTLEECIREHPNYAPAQFLLCVAYACRQERAAAEILFKQIRVLPIGKFIGESFLDIARQFLKASRTDYARHTLEAATIFGCANPNMGELLESCGAIC
jgi:tetratricopeptide (TPR) repeat protein